MIFDLTTPDCGGTGARERWKKRWRLFRVLKSDADERPYAISHPVYDPEWREFVEMVPTDPEFEWEDSWAMTRLTDEHLGLVVNTRAESLREEYGEPRSLP